MSFRSLRSRVTWYLKLSSISNNTSVFSSKHRPQRPFIVQSCILKGTLYSWTRFVKSFVLFVFRVSNLAFILRSFQLKTTVSANLKVILKTVCMSHVHTKRLLTPSISRAFLRYTKNEFLVIIIMAGHIARSNYLTAFYSRIT